MRVDFPHFETLNQRAASAQLEALQDLLARFLHLLKGQP